MTDTLPKLTVKQLAFARAYIECGNASEAYRRAYGRKNMSPGALAVEANRLLGHPKVSLMVRLLQEEHAERHEVTIEWLTKEMKEVLAKAKAEDKGSSAAVSALMGLAKLHGLIVDRQIVHGTHRHHHSAEPLPAFVRALEEALPARAEGEAPKSLPN